LLSSSIFHSQRCTLFQLNVTCMPARDISHRLQHDVNLRICGRIHSALQSINRRVASAVCLAIPPCPRSRITNITHTACPPTRVQVVPKTCENFRALCTGEKGMATTKEVPLHFKDSAFHRIIPGFMCQVFISPTLDPFFRPSIPFSDPRSPFPLSKSTSCT